jgi:hypothetical protein
MTEPDENDSAFGHLESLASMAEKLA